MDGIERGDTTRSNRFCCREDGFADGHQGDAQQKLIRIWQHTLARSESPQLDPEQPTGNALIEGTELAEDRWRIRLTQKNSSKRARVEVDEGQSRSASPLGPACRQGGIGGAGWPARRRQSRGDDLQ